MNAPDCSFAPVGPNGLSGYQVVESEFTRIFLRDLWPVEVAGLVRSWLGEPMIHTVLCTPQRKFKAVIPWLLTGCSRDALLDCLVAELLFSLFYIDDDIRDEKLSRYGHPTAYGVFGRRACEDTLAAARNLAGCGRGLLAGGGSEVHWISCLDKMEAMQQLHGVDCRDFDDYLQVAVDRTSFLGECWKRAATAAHQANLAGVITEIYPKLSMVGQIRNDLRNCSHRETWGGGRRYSDLLSGRITSVSILLWERATSDQLEWLQAEGARGQLTDLDNELELMLSACQIMDDLISLCDAELIGVEQRLLLSGLPAPVVDVCLGWIFRQFRVGTTHTYDAHLPDQARFVDAIHAICTGTIGSQVQAPLGLA